MTPSEAARRRWPSSGCRSRPCRPQLAASRMMSHGTSCSRSYSAAAGRMTSRRRTGGSAAGTRAVSSLRRKSTAIRVVNVTGGVQQSRRSVMLGRDASPSPRRARPRLRCPRRRRGLRQVRGPRAAARRRPDRQAGHASPRRPSSSASRPSRPEHHARGRRRPGGRRRRRGPGRVPRHGRRDPARRRHPGRRELAGRTASRPACSSPRPCARRSCSPQGGDVPGATSSALKALNPRGEPKAGEARRSCASARRPSPTA